MRSSAASPCPHMQGVLCSSAAAGLTHLDLSHNRLTAASLGLLLPMLRFTPAHHEALRREAERRAAEEERMRLRYAGGLDKGTFHTYARCGKSVGSGVCGGWVGRDGGATQAGRSSARAVQEGAAAAPHAQRVAGRQ